MRAQSPFQNVTAPTASRMLPQSPLKNVTAVFYRCHRYKNVTAAAASKNLTAVTVPRMLPLYRSHRFKKVTGPRASFQAMRPQSPLQERYRSHRFKNVTAVTASSRLPQSLLQERDPSHRFKNVTAGTTSRMPTRSPFHECYHSHRFKNVTEVIVVVLRCDRSRRFKNVTAATASWMLPCTVTASRMFGVPLFKNVTAVTFEALKNVTAVFYRHRYKNVTAAAASRILLLSPLQECYRGRRYKNLSTSLLDTVTAATATRMSLLPPLQESYSCHRFKNVTEVAATRSVLELVYSASRRCPLTHTLFGVSCRDNFWAMLSPLSGYEWGAWGWFQTCPKNFIFWFVVIYHFARTMHVKKLCKELPSATFEAWGSE